MPLWQILINGCGRKGSTLRRKGNGGWCPAGEVGIEGSVWTDREEKLPVPTSPGVLWIVLRVTIPGSGLLLVKSMHFAVRLKKKKATILVRNPNNTFL